MRSLTNLNWLHEVPDWPLLTAWGLRSPRCSSWGGGSGWCLRGSGTLCTPSNKQMFLDVSPRFSLQYYSHNKTWIIRDRGSEDTCCIIIKSKYKCLLSYKKNLCNLSVCNRDRGGSQFLSEGWGSDRNVECRRRSEEVGCEKDEDVITRGGG